MNFIDLMKKSLQMGGGIWYAGKQGGEEMDAYCRQQSGQTLGETRTSLLREQAEEGLEIRL